MLRDILNSRGIPFETELQGRRGMGMTLTPQSNPGISPSYSVSRASPFGKNLAAPPPTQGSDLSVPAYRTSSNSAISDQSTATYQSHSSPEMPEVPMIKDTSVPDTPGIFERDPQLGIDFILS